ncbi:hypothetical protein ACWD1Z_23220 [Streptomyces sp. NPDC002784]
MTNLKVAVEANDVAGLLRGVDETDATIHAYDVVDGRFPFHPRGHDHEITYDVLPDTDWPVRGASARARPDCERGSLA